ncbi:hypothetical protein GCM10009741_00910 [Kribbella lupini]|uniref:Acetyltransferase (GNAT) family protein n=1 Tax=Kribbella lupini TaxID=291602 RepID=A0ABN1ZZD7_9ACTN
MFLRAMERSDLDELLVVHEEGAVLGLAAVFPQSEYPFPRETIRERWAVEIEDPAGSTPSTAGSLPGAASARRTRLSR